MGPESPCADIVPPAMFPRFFVIGAQKSGTSTLHAHLDAHAEISMPRPKEVNFFLPWVYRPDGVSWYESHFRDDGLLHGEAAPEYTNHPVSAGVAERIHAHVPDARLIYIMRDPVERLVSHWQHAYARGIVDLELPELYHWAVFPRSDYVNRSRYWLQLAPFRAEFPDTSILLLTLEELRADPAETMRRVFTFLGVSPDPAGSAAGTVHNPASARRRTRRLPAAIASTRIGRVAQRAAGRLPGRVQRSAQRIVTRAVPKPVLEPELRDKIAALLRDDVECLRAQTGRSFAEWSI